MNRYSRDLTIFDVLTSTMFDPFGSMRHLLRDQRSPPYLATISLVLVSTTIVPILFERYRSNSTPIATDLISLSGIILAGMMIALLFVGATTLGLRAILGVRVTPAQISAIAIYSLTPILPLEIAGCAINYVLEGQLTVFTYLATGLMNSDDLIIRFLPCLSYLACGWCALVFTVGLAVTNRGPLTTAILGSALSAATLTVTYHLVLTGFSAVKPEVTTIIRWTVSALLSW